MQGASPQEGTTLDITNLKVKPRLEGGGKLSVDPLDVL
jgi:hypothetical protein